MKPLKDLEKKKIKKPGLDSSLPQNKLSFYLKHFRGKKCPNNFSLDQKITLSFKFQCWFRMHLHTETSLLMLNKWLLIRAHAQSWYFWNFGTFNDSFLLLDRLRPCGGNVWNSFRYLLHLYLYIHRCLSRCLLSLFCFSAFVISRLTGPQTLEMCMSKSSPAELANKTEIHVIGSQYMVKQTVPLAGPLLDPIKPVCVWFNHNTIFEQHTTKLAQ